MSTCFLKNLLWKVRRLRQNIISSFLPECPLSISRTDKTHQAEGGRNRPGNTQRKKVNVPGRFAFLGLICLYVNHLFGFEKFAGKMILQIKLLHFKSGFFYLVGQIAALKI